jgi:nucleotide-binding universal stress UspA family protein
MKEAEELARAMDASLLLVRAVVPGTAPYSGAGLPGALPVLDDVEDDARLYLERVAERIRRHDLTVEVAVAVGVPAPVVLDLADERGADLIAMTAHGRTGLDRWVFGSVTDSVVRHGKLPVLVIRSSVTQQEAPPEGIPVVGNTVVPAPNIVETETGEAPTRSARQPEPRPHRPERSPGR